MNPHESEVLGAILRTNYASFLEKCFTTLNPATPYERNWHIDVLASRLQDVADGTTTRLIVNLPPRSLKSIATSVGLVAFHLGHHPSADVICASYGMDLAAKFAFDTRRIMTSPWYQAIFPTRIDPRKSAANNFYTVQGGSRLAGSVTSGITGRGADLVVIDDPAKPDEMLSDGARETVKQWFRSTVYSRLNNKADARVVLAMQRLHVDDLTGHLVREGGEAWTLLKLAAKADTDETFSYRTPGGLKTYSRTAGELLHPARESGETLAQTQAALGSYLYAAQYQQEPVLPDGNLINLKWFPRYAEPPKKFDFVFQSWDTASKVGELNSFSVGTTWGVRGKAIYLLYVYRKKVEFPDLKRAVIEQASLHRPRVILVEEQSSGIALLQELRREGLYTLRAVKPDKDKTMRMRAQTALIENGQVWLPERAAWLPAYEMELMLFPEVPHKDQADSTSQALGYWQERLQEPGLLAFYRMEHERMGYPPIRKFNFGT